MRGDVQIAKENYSLVLDIYLGGVSGAIVKNGIIEYTAHHKVSLSKESEPEKLLQYIESLLYSNLDELTPKKKISKTYIFIDIPLSYFESHYVLFQNADKTFFDKTTKEIDAVLDIPEIYSTLIKEHVFDGVVLEHAPKNHTINGYSSLNLSSQGERKAQITQQWIQRNVYTALQKAKQVYSLGEYVFLPNIIRTKNPTDILMLGERVSTFWHKTHPVVIDSGTGMIIMQCAQIHNQTTSQIESALKSIERHHESKNLFYKEMSKLFLDAFSSAFKRDTNINYAKKPCVFVGDSFMFSIVEETLSTLKSLDFVEIQKGKDARLAYIIKSKVQ